MSHYSRFITRADKTRAVPVVGEGVVQVYLDGTSNIPDFIMTAAAAEDFGVQIAAAGSASRAPKRDGA
jgi:hypothetical protein